MSKKCCFSFGLAAFLSIVAVRFAAGYCGLYGVDVAPLMEGRVAELRERGQAGLDAALVALEQIERQTSDNSSRLSQMASDPHASQQDQDMLTRINEGLVAQQTAWRRAIDEIGGQRSCTVSHLYWYTDLDKAKAEAARTGKPILSLRMLGKLTDEFSCANSRFFRTSLYSNTEISNYLRDNFILHWQSVRPVPRVTIDFGDGRKLERTLTGNSAHYVLTASGQPLDVLPGLYSPQRFASWLTEMESLNRQWQGTSPDDRQRLLASFHTMRRNIALAEWDQDLEQLGGDRTASVTSRISAALAAARAAGQQVPELKQAAPNAVVAARAALSKTNVEVPVLRFANLGGPWIEKGMDDELWQAIANRHREEAALDQASIALMRTEFPKAALAGARAESKRRVEDPMLRVVRAFQDSISLDTVRNEYLLHRRIHEQFAAAEPATANVDKLNEWVYAELFLTPSSDPWLGLAPTDVYTALENGGQVVAAAGNSPSQ